MPLDLNLLLNSAPVSPPHSHKFNQNHSAPSAIELSNLLSPVANRNNRSLPTDRSEALDQVDGSHDQQPKEFDQLYQSIQSIPIGRKTAFHLPIPVYNNHFNQRSPRPAKQNYQQPIPITSFSFDQEHHIKCGRHQFESVKPLLDHADHTGFDLHHRISEAVFHDDSIDEGIDGLLISLVDFLDKSDPKDQLNLYRGIRSTKLITWRGILTKLCSSIYETGGTNKDQGWSMNVMMINGTIYIEDLKEKITHNHGASDVQTYFGYSYESLMTNHQFQPVNTNSQWVSVVKANLNGIRMILGGEVDCVHLQTFQNLNHRPDHYLQHNIKPDEFVEIKTSIAPNTDRDYWNLYRFKMLKFWLQSYLLGTSRIHVGLRDRKGLICGSQTYDTRSIPDLVKQRAQPAARWSSNSCLDNATKIINFILNKFRSDLSQEEVQDQNYEAFKRQTRERLDQSNFSSRLQLFEHRLQSIIWDEFEYQKKLRQQPGRNEFDEKDENDTNQIEDLSPTCSSRLDQLNQWPVYRLVFIPKSGPLSSSSLSPGAVNHHDRSNHQYSTHSVELYELSYDEVLNSVIDRKSTSWFNYHHPTLNLNHQFADPNSSDHQPAWSQENHQQRIGFLPIFWLKTLVKYRLQLLFEKQVN